LVCQSDPSIKIDVSIFKDSLGQYQTRREVHFSASPQVRLHNRLLEQAKIIQSEGQQAQEEQHGRSGPWAHQRLVRLEKTPKRGIFWRCCTELLF
jgi:hypothetical protein